MLFKEYQRLYNLRSILFFQNIYWRKFKAWIRKKIEENIGKAVRDHFRLRKEIDANTVKDIRNTFRIRKENKEIKKLF